jgi:hypothetical protein
MRPQDYGKLFLLDSIRRRRVSMVLLSDREHVCQDSFGVGGQLVNHNRKIVSREE